MFVRRGETLGSIRVDVDPGETEKRLKRSPTAKKAVEARSGSRVDPGSSESVPAAIHSPGEFHPAAEQAAKPEPEEAEVPKHSDPKAAWVDFAVSQGLDAEEAESFTKQELIDEYGG